MTGADKSKRRRESKLEKFMKHGAMVLECISAPESFMNDKDRRRAQRNTTESNLKAERHIGLRIPHNDSALDN